MELFLVPTESEPKIKTATQLVVLEDMFEIPVSFSRPEADTVEIPFHRNLAKNYA